ncbi:MULTISPECIES: VENN motif pre-toxin domain-containing protein [unclassified Serratia (in: enterobacteria)]|uniref:VENN motif pre-toxin domain-containing protein n=1 Tax=unclassified Serratia (in: enterobacteria) TaxID=2647522 RepID=UPI0030760D80
MIGEIGSQAADIARTQGDINGLKAAKEKYPDKTAEQLRETKEYKDAMKQYGTGSALQQGIQAATAAIQGLAGGDMAKALAGASAPYLAEVIHNMTTSADGKTVNTEANLMAHAVLGAVTAAVNGNSALAGASGAVMGEYIAQQMYPGIERKDLTEEQRQTISALGTLAAGLVGGIVGDSTADAVAGGQAGKNALENNNLGIGSDLGFWLGKTPDCDTACKTDIAKGVANGNLIVSAGIGAAAGGALIVAASPEIAAAAKAALEGCKSAPAICLNNAGLQIAEAVTPGGVGAAGAIGVGKTVAEAAAAKAEAVAANVAKNTTGTVFDSIKATQPAIPGTSIPKSFELTVDGQTIWVNPNATKHMGEYLTRNGLSHSTSEGSQAMLTSLQSAVRDASSQGIKFNEMMQVGRWELVFSQRPTDPYPVLKHALYK